MTRQPIGLHAVTHLPNGSDPIDWSYYQTNYDVPLWQYGYGNAAWSESWGFNEWTIDNGCIHNGYSDGLLDYEFAFRLRLGPQYSIWDVAVMGVTDIDGGKLSVYLATDSDNQDDFPGEHPQPLGLMNEVPLVSDNWIQLCGDSPATGTYQALDYYGPLQEKNVMPTIGIQFRIGGAPGAVMTGWGDFFGPIGESFYPVTLGGPGVWAIKMKVTGKNVLSSDYHCRTSSIVVARKSFATIGGVGRV